MPERKRAKPSIRSESDRHLMLSEDVTPTVLGRLIDIQAESSRLDVKTRGVVKTIRRLFAVGFTIITFLFACCALALIVLATWELWRGINPYSMTSLRERFSSLLESIGLLTIAVAAFELGQTILEEEVWREVHTSGPTRVRRFLSRFMIVIIVALAIEAMISVFEFAHDDPTHLPHASLIGIAAAVLLAGWGIFIKFNTGAEMLEPEAMEEAKREDEKIFSPEQSTANSSSEEG
jgi:hypothetical protein